MIRIMKEVKDGKLILSIGGRLDFNTAPELEKEFNELDGINGIIIDFEKLEYISSSGLGLILKFKKIVNDTKIINCNDEVYEVFSMTGFAEIMDVEKKAE